MWLNNMMRKHTRSLANLSNIIKARIQSSKILHNNNLYNWKALGNKPYSLLNLIPITLWWGLFFNEVVCSEKCISKLITLGCIVRKLKIEISYLNWAVTVIQNECTKQSIKMQMNASHFAALFCFVVLLFFHLFGFFFGYTCCLPLNISRQK